MATIAELLQQQLYSKKVEAESEFAKRDTSHCPAAVIHLEKAVYNTISKSNYTDTFFRFNFPRGCGKEVNEMLEKNKVFSVLAPHVVSIYTVDQLVISMNPFTNQVSVGLM
jgi:hypothetical protein